MVRNTKRVIWRFIEPDGGLANKNGGGWHAWEGLSKAPVLCQPSCGSKSETDGIAEWRGGGDSKARREEGGLVFSKQA